MKARRSDTRAIERCPVCGARVDAREATCPICGARVWRASGPRIGWQFPHMLFGIALTIAAMWAFLWYLEPSLGAPPAPSATATRSRTPWPTATYTDTPSPSATASPTRSATPTADCVKYTVESSEGLSIIADKFGVSADAIQERNRLNSPDEIKPGQELCIPIAREAAESLTPPPTGTPTPLTYTVVRGDNLGSIAERYDTTVALIVEANNLSEDSILGVGQSLIIPRIFDSPTPPPPTETRTRTAVPPTVTPTLTETPMRYKYQPPTLLHPLDGADFHGPDAVVALAWTSVALLEPDEWYMLTVWYTVEGQEHKMLQVTTKDTSWRLSGEDYRYQETFEDIRWTVNVVRQTESGEVLSLSRPSQSGSFIWY